MNLLSIYPLPGISYTHDAAACLASADGVLYACEEERLLRGQHAIAHFPERSAMLGLKSTGIRPEQLDYLVVTSMDRCWERPDYKERLQFVRDQLLIHADTPVTCVAHHEAHSALAVLSSPFDRCIFLTLDGGGDGQMGHWGIYQDGHFQIIEHFDFSPAIFYSFITTISGYHLFEEGKTMGLAAYGDLDQRLMSWFRHHFSIRLDGVGLEIPHLKIEWSTAFDPRRIDPDSFARHKYYGLSVRFIGDEDLNWIGDILPADIARTGQTFFQELVRKIVNKLVDRTGIRKVACAGGAFQNVVGNGHLFDIPEVDISIPMAPHDAGLALGAALWLRNRLGYPRPTFPLSPYLGPVFSDDAVCGALNHFGLPHVRPADSLSIVAQAVAAGKVVGWFHGPAEYGARALGARSVLADPRNPDAKARLNQLLKKRDWFMPYAPSILEEYGDEYFENFRPSPYMNVAFRVRKGKASLIPAAVHVDGTCRVHSIGYQQNPVYHQLISRFYQFTGIPMMLNTSLNRHGIPMVATPRQALQHLLEGMFDILVIEGYLVEAPPRTIAHRPARDEGYHLGAMALRHAGTLVHRGCLEGAAAVLARAGIPLEVSVSGFARGDTIVWDRSSSLDELEAWWNTAPKNKPMVHYRG